MKLEYCFYDETIIIPFVSHCTLTRTTSKKITDDYMQKILTLCSVAPKLSIIHLCEETPNTERDETQAIKVLPTSPNISLFLM
jgi:hypothetical protein